MSCMMIEDLKTHTLLYRHLLPKTQPLSEENNDTTYKLEDSQYEKQNRCGNVQIELQQPCSKSFSFLSFSLHFYSGNFNHS